MSAFSDDGLDDLSDQESLYAESHVTSPADGYFSPRDHPQETFVEQSSVQTHSDSKAQEAAGQRAQQGQGSPPSQGSPVSFIESIRWPQETAPLLDAGPAPPDYASATARRPRGEHGPNASPVGEGAHRSADYGSVPLSTSEAPAGHIENQQEELVWPFGNRNNPFGPDFPVRHGRDPFRSNSATFASHTGHFANLSDPIGTNSGPFARRHEPEAMLDSTVHDANVHEEVALLNHKRHQNQSRRRWLMQLRNICCEPLSILNALLVLAIIGLVVLLVKATDHDGGKGRNASDNDPINLPGSDNGRNEMDYDWSNGTLPVHADNDSRCAYQYYSRSASFGFTDITEFSFSEMIGISTRKQMDISGKVWISPASPGQDVDIQGWISYAASEPNYIGDIKQHVNDDGIALTLADSASEPKGCIDVAVGLYVQEGVSLEEFVAASTNLDIEVMDGFTTALPVTARKSTISTRRGDIEMAYWSSRETYIDSSSGSISGRFALRDVLSIRSTSGYINTHVKPLEADHDKPVPAKLSVISNSGSISLDMDLYNVPERDYETYIHGHSSSVKGSIIHGTKTELASNSGTVNLDVLPYRAEEKGGSTLETNSGSGTTTLQLLSPYTAKKLQKDHTMDTDARESDLMTAPANNIDPFAYDGYSPNGAVLNLLRSSHTSSSGTLRLVYPKEWEGTIEGHSNSGSIRVVGEGVYKIVDQDLGFVKHHYIGRRGSADSKLGFSTTSGSVDIRFGDF